MRAQVAVHSHACTSAAAAAVGRRAAPYGRFARPAAPRRQRPAAVARPTAAASSTPSSPTGLFQPPLPSYSEWPVTARVALRTGLYISVLGLAIVFVPGAVFGAVFDARCECDASSSFSQACIASAAGMWCPLLSRSPAPLRLPASPRSRVPLGWVRVGGVLAALFGSYYCGAALDDAAGRHPAYFYASTIIGRLALSAAFSVLVATGAVEPGLLWLAAANAASSLLLLSAARQRRRQDGSAAAASTAA